MPAIIAELTGQNRPGRRVIELALWALVAAGAGRRRRALGLQRWERIHHLVRLGREAEQREVAPGR
jgi:hypothetical protein